MRALCPEGSCNYQTQSGCGADQACRPTYTVDQSDIEPGCQPVGAGKTGEACSEWTDCARGYLCAVGQCRKICCGGDWSACDFGREPYPSAQGGSERRGRSIAGRTCAFRSVPATCSTPKRAMTSLVVTASSSIPRAPKPARRRAPRSSASPAAGRASANAGSPAWPASAGASARQKRADSRRARPKRARVCTSIAIQPGVGECTPGWD